MIIYIFFYLSKKSSKFLSDALLSIPRCQNRTGSLHTVNRFHDEAGKLLFNLTFTHSFCSHPLLSNLNHRASLRSTHVPKIHKKFPSKKNTI